MDFFAQNYIHIRFENAHMACNGLNRLKKMVNQDEGKIECAVGNREICVWQSKKAEIVLFYF